MKVNQPDGQSRAGHALVLRTVSAVALATIALGAAWYGGWTATALLGAFAMIVFREWMAITEGASTLLMAYAIPVLVGLALWMLGEPGWSLAIVIAGMAVAGIGGNRQWRSLGVLYAAMFGLSPLVVRLSPDHGFAGLMFVFSIVWGTDTAAYFIGRALGGPKLWVRVSPNKTWSGAIGGALAGVAAGLAVVLAAGLVIAPATAMVALMLSIATQCGDLFESSVKRRFGTKDSGKLIPGHGGLMDRVDGLIFAATAAALLGWLRIPESPASGLLQW